MYDHPEILRTQLRAILRAASHGKIAIMFPMIATLDEWRDALAMVKEEQLAMGAPSVQVGIMRSSAILRSRALARGVRFARVVATFTFTEVSGPEKAHKTWQRILACSRHVLQRTLKG